VTFWLILLAALAGGLVLTLLYDDGPPARVARLCAAMLLGLLVFGFAAFLGAMAAGTLNGFAVGLGMVATAAPCALLTRAPLRRQLLQAFRFPKPTAHDAINAIALVALLGLVMAGAAYFTPQPAVDPQFPAVATAVTNNLGDLPLHLAIITGFTSGQNYPPMDPELSGSRLAYPFMVDFLAAVFSWCGLSLPQALFVENLILGIVLVGLLHGFTLRLTESAPAARLAPWLLLLSGGLGWTLLFQDLQTASLMALPRDFTIGPDTGYRWGNSLTTLLIPQRSLLLGVPILLIVMDAWWTAVRREDGDRWFLAAGLLAGTLPLCHSFFFLVVGLMAACEAALFPGRGWLRFAGAALALAVPQMLWMAQGTSMRPGGFLAFSPGWDHGDTNAIWFWLKNSGLFLPLLGVAIYRGEGRAVRFYAPFLLCFLISNLFRLAPWIWDNIKVLYVWYVASVPLVALVVARMPRVLAAACVALLVLAGALDNWRVVSRARELIVLDAAGVGFAVGLQVHTPPTALTVHAPVYDSPVYLSGRRSMLGYDGHIWSRGLNGGTRVDDIRRIYSGDAAAAELARRYGIQYLIWGPAERREYPGQPWFVRALRPKFGHRGYVLYEIPPTR